MSKDEQQKQEKQQVAEETTSDKPEAVKETVVEPAAEKTTPKKTEAVKETTDESATEDVKKEEASKVDATELAKLRDDVKGLKEELNKLNDVKEEWYTKREQFSKQIKSKIDDIKKSKDDRNVKTSEVQSIKGERDALNGEIKTIISDLKVLNEQKQKMFGSSNTGGPRVDPARVKSQIEKLELKLETEVMSFEKEKGVNKQIKELKAQIKGVEGTGDVLEQIKVKSRELRDLRGKAKEKHSVVQSRATESQEQHESLLSRSKEVDELKKKEEEAYKKFFEYKKQFNELNDQLKAKIKIINANSKDVAKVKKQKRAKREAENRKNLEELEKGVEEKIKKGGKLTTEDLLIFQGR